MGVQVIVDRRLLENLRRAALALLLLSGVMFAQGQQQSPHSPSPDAPKQDKSAARGREGVVRISVTLVQIDAAVTDKKGRPVTDMRAEDFRISEDGRSQEITNFSYVATESAAQPQPGGPPSGPSGRSTPPPPPPQLRPEQVRRTIALVVDDLGMSFETMAGVRDGLKKFVNEQMQPGDLVAIIRTGAGMGALQQFTADKRQLYAAIERVRWNPFGRGGVSAFARIEPSAVRAAPGSSGMPRPNPRAAGPQAPGDPSASSGAPSSGQDNLDQFHDEIYSVGTLGALNFIVRGLRELPGRKSVVLFSDGFQVFNREGSNQRVLDSLRRLVDLANRASVVIYTIDARGLQTLMLGAADDVSGRTAQQVEEQLQNRRTAFFNSQDGLNYLAQETGGFFVRNSNDIGSQIKRVLDDQKGYYLIGYVPEQTTFRPDQGQRPFHKVSLTVTRPGLIVRSRTGFYGVAEEEARPAPRSPGGQLLAALTSPFTSGAVHLRLTSLFAEAPKAGPYVRSLLHIDARDLTYAEAQDGSHNATAQIVAVTYGDDGKVVQQESREYKISILPSAFQHTLQQGILYTVNVPIKKPGAYQLRCAVRDASSERVGSANQFIQVPDLGKRRLTLSGLVLRAHTDARAQDGRKPSNGDPTEASEQNAPAGEAEWDILAGPAVRRFRRGVAVDYGFRIYNARVDPATKLPKLTAEPIILREGRPVFVGEVKPVATGGDLDLRRLAARGLLRLGSDLPPGDYVLQLIITDELAPEKHRTTTQWIDFEIYQ